MPTKNLYKLRNGLIVEAKMKRASISNYNAKVIRVPKSSSHFRFGVGETMFLLMGVSGDKTNPITWLGGSYGKDFDVVGKIENKIQKFPKNLYKLRNGLLVKILPSGSRDIEVVLRPKKKRIIPGWDIGTVHCLAHGNSEDGSFPPTTWRGGDYGRAFDIIGKVKLIP